MYRRLLEEQMRLVQEGEDPMNTYRDASQNEIIIAPCESFDYPGYEGIPRGPFTNIVYTQKNSKLLVVLLESKFTNQVINQISKLSK